jgi:hypothetical protein
MNKNCAYAKSSGTGRRISPTWKRHAALGIVPHRASLVSKARSAREARAAIFHTTELQLEGVEAFYDLPAPFDLVPETVIVAENDLVPVGTNPDTHPVCLGFYGSA